MDMWNKLPRRKSGVQSKRDTESERRGERNGYPVALGHQIFLQLSLNYPILRPVKKEPTLAHLVIEGHCAGPAVCPLSRVKAGSVVCIRQLATAPELKERLRELGFVEQQHIKLLTRDSNFICQVCNARLGISQKLADSILVETVETALVSA